MKMHMTITTASNVNWRNNSVINNNQISRTTKDWEDTVVVKMREKKINETKEIKVKNISLYEHFLILNEKEYVILHALSKN